jgi:Family of unknown function (DUF5985)
MNEMLIGAIAAASIAAGLFFFRFWRTTRDRFFLLFALSFWIEGVNRVVLYELAGLDDDAPVYFLIRLLAYGLILVAVIDKNRGPRRRE